MNAATEGTLIIQDFGFGGTQDTVRLLNSGLANFAAVQSHAFYFANINTTIITPVGGNGNNIWLSGINSNTLTAGMFTFV